MSHTPGPALHSESQTSESQAVNSPDVDRPVNKKLSSSEENNIDQFGSGRDAVCFTAGFTGAMFGAGTIHAYLVADREPPGVVAGISCGAVNAVALQRCYRELQNAPIAGAQREISRWRWFRQYLSFLTDEPLGAIWRGLPRLTDFSADLPPVQDAAIESFGKDDTKAYWMDQEKRARRELFLLMKLADWLARLPLKISLIATAVVNYVRLTERIPDWSNWRRIKYTAEKIYIGLVLIGHVAFHPFWFKESRFRTTPNTEIKFYKPSYWLRPLLGWPIYLSAWLVLLAISEIGLAIVLPFVHANGRTQKLHEVMIHVMDGIGIAAAMIVYLRRRPVQKWIWQRLSPLFSSHVRRIGWMTLLSVADYAVLKLMDSHAISRYFGKQWELPNEVVGFVLFAFFLFCAMVVAIFELAVLVSLHWHRVRRLVEKCKRPLWLGGGLVVTEAALILLDAYFVHGVLTIVLMLLPIALCGASILALVAVRTLPFVVGYFKAKGRPLISFIVGDLMTVVIVGVQAVSLVGILIQRYGETAKVLLIACVGVESLAIAAGVIVNCQTQASKPSAPTTQDSLKKRMLSWISTQAFRSLEMERALIHKFQMLVRLTRLFGHEGKSDRLKDDPMPVVIVAAPLQTIHREGAKRGVSQVWAKKDIRIVDALAAALAFPGLYEPLHLDTKNSERDAADIKYWNIDGSPEVLDLVERCENTRESAPRAF